MAQIFPQFNDCNITKKILPELPEGMVRDVSKMPEYLKTQNESSVISKKTMKKSSSKATFKDENLKTYEKNGELFCEDPYQQYQATPHLPYSNSMGNLSQLPIDSNL